MTEFIPGNVEWISLMSKNSHTPVRVKAKIAPHVSAARNEFQILQTGQASDNYIVEPPLCNLNR